MNVNRIVFILSLGGIACTGDEVGRPAGEIADKNPSDVNSIEGEVICTEEAAIHAYESCWPQNDHTHKACNLKCGSLHEEFSCEMVKCKLYCREDLIVDMNECSAAFNCQHDEIVSCMVECFDEAQACYDGVDTSCMETDLCAQVNLNCVNEKCNTPI